MRVSTLVTFAVVVGYQLVVSCPPSQELELEAARCLAEMMQFLEAEESERAYKCPNLKAGTDCVANILESCKDNEALRTEYDNMKKRLETSREDYEKFCGGSSMARSSLLLLLTGCVLSLWLRSSH